MPDQRHWIRVGGDQGANSVLADSVFTVAAAREIAGQYGEFSSFRVSALPAGDEVSSGRLNGEWSLLTPQGRPPNLAEYWGWQLSFDFSAVRDSDFLGASERTSFRVLYRVQLDVEDASDNMTQLAATAGVANPVQGLFGFDEAFPVGPNPDTNYEWGTYGRAGRMMVGITVSDVGCLPQECAERLRGAATELAQDVAAQLPGIRFYGAGRLLEPEDDGFLRRAGHFAGWFDERVFGIGGVEPPPRPPDLPPAPPAALPGPGAPGTRR